ncbi:MAG: type II toxin-antitoxin system RelE/ParE family toxin [Bacteroidales bacterium]|nr:type II toxin-antitoxin system RelE/ParE family toxin [Bacteroidales bacterium]
MLGLKEIINYLELKFSEKDTRKFAKKFDKQLSIIRTNPKLFPLSTDSNSVRRAIVAKLTSIYFEIDEDIINLVSISDNRKNLENIKL